MLHLRVKWAFFVPFILATRIFCNRQCISIEPSDANGTQISVPEHSTANFTFKLARDCSDYGVHNIKLRVQKTTGKQDLLCMVTLANDRCIKSKVKTCQCLRDPSGLFSIAIVVNRENNGTWSWTITAGNINDKIFTEVHVKRFENVTTTPSFATTLTEVSETTLDTTLSPGDTPHFASQPFGIFLISVNAGIVAAVIFRTVVKQRRRICSRTERAQSAEVNVPIQMRYNPEVPQLREPRAAEAESDDSQNRRSDATSSSNTYESVSDDESSVEGGTFLCVLNVETDSGEGDFYLHPVASSDDLEGKGDESSDGEDPACYINVENTDN